MIEQHHLSERHACRLVGLPRDSYRHSPQPSELNATLGEQIRHTALVRRRFGYRRIHGLLEEPTGRFVPQVMQAQVIASCALKRTPECELDSIDVRCEHELAGSRLRGQNAAGTQRKRHEARLAVLGDAAGQIEVALGQMDVRPAQLDHFAAAHGRIDGKTGYRPNPTTRLQSGLDENTRRWTLRPSLERGDGYVALALREPMRVTAGAKECLLFALRHSHDLGSLRIMLVFDVFTNTPLDLLTGGLGRQAQIAEVGCDHVLLLKVAVALIALLCGWASNELTRGRIDGEVDLPLAPRDRDYAAQEFELFLDCRTFDLLAACIPVCRNI